MSKQPRPRPNALATLRAGQQSRSTTPDAAPGTEAAQGAAPAPLSPLPTALEITQTVAGAQNPADAALALFHRRPGEVGHAIVGANPVDSAKAAAYYAPRAAVAAHAGLLALLPNPEELDQVADDDESDLTAEHLELRERCDQVIEASAAAADASVWTIGRALDVMVKLRLHRHTHATLDAYVQDKLGRGYRQTRRWRQGWALAEAAALRSSGGNLPPNERQLRELLPAEKTHGRDAAAELLAEARRALPTQLPDDHRAALEVVARTAAEVVRRFAAAEAEDGIVDAEVIEDADDQEQPDDAGPEQAAAVEADPLALIERVLNSTRADRRALKRPLMLDMLTTDPLGYMSLRGELLAALDALKAAVDRAPALPPEAARAAVGLGDDGGVTAWQDDDRRIVATVHRPAADWPNPAHSRCRRDECPTAAVWLHATQYAKDPATTWCDQHLPERMRPAGVPAPRTAEGELVETGDPQQNPGQLGVPVAS